MKKSVGRKPVWPIFAALAVLVAILSWAWLSQADAARSVKRVAHADPALQTAARRAQSELGGFIGELAHPKPGEQFAIKGAFPTADGPEYLWVRDPEYRGGVFTGTLDQVPMAYQGAGKGSIVTVTKEEVFDWMIRENGRTRGGYTERVLSSAPSG